MALGIAALLLAALGQIYFFYRRDYLWDGLVWHSLAVLCFLWACKLAAVSRQDRGPVVRHPSLLQALETGARQVLAWARNTPVQAALMAGGLLLSFFAVLLARDRAWNAATYDVVVTWLLGVVAVMAAAWWPARRPVPSEKTILRPREWRVRLHAASSAGWEHLKPRWTEVATVAALTGLAWLLRAAALNTVPFTLGGDEAWHGLLARQVLSRELRNPFVMGYMSMPTFFYWPLSWSLRLVADNMVALRLPAALVGTATVPAFYLLVRQLWGRCSALLAAVLLATYDYHVHYSRLGANNIWDPLFAVVIFWLLEQGLRRSDTAGQRRAFILAGAVMGLSAYFYTGARLLPPLVALYIGFYWLKSRRDRTGQVLAGNLALLGLAFVVVAGPMLSFALAHPDDWNARVNQVGIIQSGWLSREPGLTGKSTARILAEQSARSAGAFHVFSDRTLWYGAGRPLLGFLAGLFAILGFAWAVAHWRERRCFLALLWLGAVIVAGGVLTENPPSSQRLVMAIPPVVLLVTVGVEKSVRLIGSFLIGHREMESPSATTLPIGMEAQENRRIWEGAVLGSLILALALSSINFYFLEFTPSRTYGSQNGETATRIGHYLQDLPAGTRVFFFGAPRIYWNFGTMTFLAPQVEGEDVVEPLTSPPDIDESGPAVFVFLPERAGELAYVQQAYPQGRLAPGLAPQGEEQITVYEVR